MSPSPGETMVAEHSSKVEVRGYEMFPRGAPRQYNSA